MVRNATIGGQQRLYRTTDGGENWEEVRSNNSDTTYESMNFISDKIGWISTFPYPASILHTVNGGKNWAKYYTPESFISISFIDSSTGWGASLGEIYITTDAGKTWTPQRAFSTHLQKVKFIDKKNGFAIGSFGVILNTTTGGITSIEEPKNIETINDFVLYQNYPNPFNPVTIINYTLPKDEFVILKVYDILGREVTTLVNEGKQSGTYSVNFDASNLASGIYFYTLQAGSIVKTNKMILLR